MKTATTELFEEALLAEFVIVNPDLALQLASWAARRSGRMVALPTITNAFASVDAAMTEGFSPPDSKPMDDPTE